MSVKSMWNLVQCVGTFVMNYCRHLVSMVAKIQESCSADMLSLYYIHNPRLPHAQCSFTLNVHVLSIVSIQLSNS